MTKSEFLLSMDELLGLDSGTLQGDEELEELRNWDSTALISLIAMIDSNLGIRVSPRQIVNCSTVEDLLQLAKLKTSAYTR
jgi:acyl carrier protein